MVVVERAVPIQCLGKEVTRDHLPGIIRKTAVVGECDVEEIARLRCFQIDLNNLEQIAEKRRECAQRP
jgi:hypothetical protein